MNFIAFAGAFRLFFTHINKKLVKMINIYVLKILDVQCIIISNRDYNNRDLIYCILQMTLEG